MKARWQFDCMLPLGYFPGVFMLTERTKELMFIKSEPEGDLLCLTGEMKMRVQHLMQRCCTLSPPETYIHVSGQHTSSERRSTLTSALNQFDVTRRTGSGIMNHEHTDPHN